MATVIHPTAVVHPGAKIGQDVQIGAYCVIEEIVEIGELAAVEVDALRFCLGAVLADTVAAGAAIEIETLPGAGWCPDCAQTVPIHQLYDACGRCGGYRVQASAGREMRVKALEVD